MKKLLTLLVVSWTLAGCGSAWVVRRDQDGGIIGYRNYSSLEDAHQAVLTLIHCPAHKFISDQYYSSTRTAVMPMQSTNYSQGTVYGSYGSASYSGSQTQTNYVPVTVDNSWREYTYQCVEVSETPVSVSNAGSRILFQTAEYPNQSTGEGTVNLAKAIQSTEDGKKAKAALQAEFEKRKMNLRFMESQIRSSGTVTREQYKNALSHHQAVLKTYEMELSAPIIVKMKSILQVIGQKRGLGRVWENGDPTTMVDLTDELTQEYEKLSPEKLVKK
ncbi:MAG: hypothetical protein ACKOX6_08570 [Bdellovibrio sp.]